MQNLRVFSFVYESAARLLCFSSVSRRNDGFFHASSTKSLLRSRVMSTATCSAQAIDRHSVNATSNAKSNTLSEDLRHLLRHMANSVVVCTALANVNNATPAEHKAVAPIGLVMSSFTSLSLYPRPIVTFNIAVPSRTESAIAQTRHFMIHVLSGDAKGAQVADVFRSGNAHPDKTFHDLHRSGCHIARNSPTPGSLPGADQPFLRGPGILYALRCKLLDEPLNGLVSVQDHVIVLGEVLEIIDDNTETVDSSGTLQISLVYADRHYRHVASSKIAEGLREP